MTHTKRNLKEVKETTKTSKLIMKCPVEGCKSKHSNIVILAHHIAIVKDSRHKRWIHENGILEESKSEKELVDEIKEILQSRMRYDTTTKSYEFY